MKDGGWEFRRIWQLIFEFWVGLLMDRAVEVGEGDAARTVAACSSWTVGIAAGCRHHRPPSARRGRRMIERCLSLDLAQMTQPRRLLILSSMGFLDLAVGWMLLATLPTPSLSGTSPSTRHHHRRCWLAGGIGRRPPSADTRAAIPLAAVRHHGQPHAVTVRDIAVPLPAARWVFGCPSSPSTAVLAGR
ncbi:hypothetical protein ACLOJK_038028 [Asimina triloba]